MDRHFEVLFEDERFVVIDKPESYFVHTPENQDLRKFIDPSRVILSQLRRQVGRTLYPAHRLDVATSGILVYAKDSEAAKFFSFALQAGRVEKTYMGVCRGWPREACFRVELDLESDSSSAMLPSETHFEVLHHIQCSPGVPGDRFPKSRYSLIRARPITGRYHQIRRHLNRISHPLVGDNEHGDSRHNRFFRESFGLQGLCLRAMEYKIEMPEMNQTMHLKAPLNPKWDKLFEIFGLELGSCFEDLRPRTSMDGREILLA